MSPRYCLYYAALVLAFVKSPVINPDDPLEFPGNFEVERMEESIPFRYEGEPVSLDTELFIPVGREPDAFILFMPGFGTGYSAYEIYLEHFASHGFLGVGMDFFSSSALSGDGEHDNRADQGIEVIRYLQAKYPQYKDLPVWTVGHSLGGKIAFYIASLKPGMVKGVMAMDPSNAGGGPCLIYPNQCTNDPVAPNNEEGQEGIMKQMNQTGGTSSMIFRSKPDPLTNPEGQFNADNFYFGADGAGLDAAPSPVWYYDFGPFPHALYVPNLPSYQVQIIKRTMLAFLQQEVRGVDTEAYLTGNIMQADIDEKRLVRAECCIH